jgi:hypothetical protein
VADEDGGATVPLPAACFDRAGAAVQATGRRSSQESPLSATLGGPESLEVATVRDGCRQAWATDARPWLRTAAR